MYEANLNVLNSAKKFLISVISEPLLFASRYFVFKPHIHKVRQYLINKYGAELVSGSPNYIIKEGIGETGKNENGVFFFYFTSGELTRPMPSDKFSMLTQQLIDCMLFPELAVANELKEAYVLNETNTFLEKEKPEIALNYWQQTRKTAASNKLYEEVSLRDELGRSKEMLERLKKITDERKKKTLLCRPETAKLLLNEFAEIVKPEEKQTFDDIVEKLASGKRGLPEPIITEAGLIESALTGKIPVVKRGGEKKLSYCLVFQYLKDNPNKTLHEICGAISRPYPTVVYGAATLKRYFNFVKGDGRGQYNLKLSLTQEAIQKLAEAKQRISNTASQSDKK